MQQKKQKDAAGNFYPCLCLDVKRRGPSAHPKKASNSGATAPGGERGKERQDTEKKDTERRARQTTPIPAPQNWGRGQDFYSVAHGALMVCLADPILPETLAAMQKHKPQRVICLDTAFHGNDQLKTNTVLEMKSHGIEFRTV